jgi:hypothetical protein
MTDKDIKEKISEYKRRKLSEACCYVVDPCGCYVDPCGCYVDPCGCYSTSCCC